MEESFVEEADDQCGLARQGGVDGLAGKEVEIEFSCFRTYETGPLSPGGMAVQSHPT